MAQKPKRSKAERLAKKRRNRHIAELKLLEKRRLATIQQKQELSNMIARKEQQQQRKFKEPAESQISITKSAEPEKNIVTIEGKTYIADPMPTPVEVAKELVEVIIDEEDKTSWREEFVELLNEDEDIPDSIKKRVNEYWQNPTEQKRLAVIGAIQKEEFASHQQKVESILQITGIYQAVLDELMVQLPVKTQDFLLDCTNEVIDEVGLDVLQQRLRNNQMELTDLILEPYERYENIDRIEYTAQKFLQIIYAGHVPGRVMSKLSSVIEVEEHAKVYFSRKKGLFYLK